SNHLLNTPWPKVTSIKSQFNTYIESNSQIYANDLFCILIDNTKAQENALPNIGVSKEFEKQLSPIFIQTENYCTLASTVLLFDDDNIVNFILYTFNKGQLKNDYIFSFNIK